MLWKLVINNANPKIGNELITTRKIKSNNYKRGM